MLKFCKTPEPSPSCDCNRVDEGAANCVVPSKPGVPKLKLIVCPGCAPPAKLNVAVAPGPPGGGNVVLTVLRAPSLVNVNVPDPTTTKEVPGGPASSLARVPVNQFQLLSAVF